MTWTFQGHGLCKITLWAISQLFMGKLLPNFLNTRYGLFQSLSISQNHFKQFERETYANALHSPKLCKKVSLTITFELKHMEKKDACHSFAICMPNPFLLIDKICLN